MSGHEVLNREVDKVIKYYNGEIGGLAVDKK